MQMPLFVRRWKRRRDWYAYGRTNKRIRELERLYEDFAYCCPDYAAQISQEIDKQAARRMQLRTILTQEV